MKKFNEILKSAVEENQESKTLNERIYVVDDDYDRADQMNDVMSLTDYMRRMYNNPSMYKYSTKERREVEERNEKTEREQELMDKKIAWLQDRDRTNIQNRHEINKKMIDYDQNMEREVTKRDANYNSTMTQRYKNQQDYNRDIYNSELKFNQDNYSDYMKYRTTIGKEEGQNFRSRENRLQQKELEEIKQKYNKEMREIERNYDIQSRQADNQTKIELAKINAEAQSKRAEEEAKSRIAENKYKYADIKEKKEIRENEENKIQYRNAIYKAIGKNTNGGKFLQSFIKKDNSNLADEKFELMYMAINGIDFINKDGTDYNFIDVNDQKAYTNKYKTRFTYDEASDAYANYTNSIMKINDAYKKIDQDSKYEPNQSGFVAYLTYIAENGLTPKVKLKENYEVTSEYEKKIIFGDLLENIKDFTIMNETNETTAGNANQANKNAMEMQKLQGKGLATQAEVNKAKMQANVTERQHANDSFNKANRDQIDPLTGEKATDRGFNEEADPRLQILNAKKQNIMKQEAKHDETIQKQKDNITRQEENIKKQNMIKNAASTKSNNKEEQTGDLSSTSSL